MLNCISVMPELAIVLAVQGAHYHYYGKTLRLGRKIEHFTLNLNDSHGLRAYLNILLPLVGLKVDEFLEWSSRSMLRRKRAYTHLSSYPCHIAIFLLY
jgi:hypothetical protein